VTDDDVSGHRAPHGYLADIAPSARPPRPDCRPRLPPARGRPGPPAVAQPGSRCSQPAQAGDAIRRLRPPGQRGCLLDGRPSAARGRRSGGVSRWAIDTIVRPPDRRERLARPARSRRRPRWSPRRARSSRGRRAGAARATNLAPPPTGCRAAHRGVHASGRSSSHQPSPRASARPRRAVAVGARRRPGVSLAPSPRCHRRDLRRRWRCRRGAALPGRRRRRRRRGGPPDPDVVGDGGVEQEPVLGDQADGPAGGPPAPPPGRPADSAARGVGQAAEQLGELVAPVCRRWPRLPACTQIGVTQHRRTVAVAKFQPADGHVGAASACPSSGSGTSSGGEHA
jgi:hypothetical protein